MKSWKISGLIVAVSLCVSASAHAGAILQDTGSWYAFGFGAVGSFGIDASSESNWTFTAASSNYFQVTDAYLRGDQFTVYDFGSLVGTTNPVAVDGVTSGVADPDAAWADPTFSHGNFLLGAGAHSLTIQTATSPFGGGTAFFRDVTAGVTPEPGAMPLMALGLLGLAVVARRRA